MGSNGSTPPFGTLLALRRLLRHRWAEAASRRALSPQVLHRLGSHVSASERLHTGQIRVIAEASLPWSYLRRHASPRERAIMLFSKYRVWDTEHNNGVLIYLLMPEHAIEIVADRAVARHIPALEWQQLVAQMSALFQQLKYEEGLIQAIDGVSQRLAQHFPRSGGAAQVNELPDTPVGPSSA
jgi:uncharacterized membrane protein